MSIKIHVPTLGESVTEATLATWFKKPGDAVSADEMICELETDKVTIEVPSPAAGILKELLVKAGETVSRDGLLATLEEGPGASSPKEQSAKPPSEPSGDVALEKPSAKSPEDAPSAKRLMSETGITPAQVTPSGKDGRIMKEDVLRAKQAPQQNAPAPPPRPAKADGAHEERVEMSRLRRTIAKRLKESQNTAATLTTYNEVDMSTILALRAEYKELFYQKHGVKLGFMSFFIKACCHALKEIPDINAEIDGTDIVYKNYVNMGVAVGTPSGLVVPVLKNAETMGFAEIEKTINELGMRARDGKLEMRDMQGGSFTISNGGVYGSLMSSPIINPPQSGILGMHKIQDRPVAIDGEIKIRPMMYLALSYDHRIVDGKGAVSFLVRVKDLLEEPYFLMMDL